MIKLNLELDPYDLYQLEEFGGSRPAFPYNWHNSSIKFGPVVAHRKHTVTCGSDPYAGEEWKFVLGNIVVRVSSLITWHWIATWSRSGKVFMGSTEGSLSMRFFMWLFYICEYRYEWYMHNEYEPDPMGELSDYE